MRHIILGYINWYWYSVLFARLLLEFLVVTLVDVLSFILATARIFLQITADWVLDIL